MAKKKQNLDIYELLEQALVKESAQPYEVPGNWVWTRLGNVTKVIGGGTPPSGVIEYYENGSIPWISPVDLSGYTDIYISRGNKNITELGLKKSSAKLMPRGTVLLSSRAPIGYVAIAENELCTNQGFKSFPPSPCFMPEYLYFYLKYSKDLLESYSSGTTFLEISGSKAALVEFPLPPLAEQQRIVGRIESLFEKLDQAKGLIQEALDSFENRKAAILHKAFSGELTKNWREENNIGMESWKKCKLGDYANTKYGYTESATNEEIGPKFLRITDIQEGCVSWGIVPFCPINDEDFEKYKLKIGDIVVARTGATTGKSYFIVDEVDAVFASYLIRININNTKKISPGFLYKFLQSQFYWSQITELSSGIAQPGVNASKLKTIIVPLPSIHEQNEIVHILDNFFEKEDTAKKYYELISNIDFMKKSILARAFRGELGTNDPEEENAIELLKKVLSERVGEPG